MKRAGALTQALLQQILGVEAQVILNKRRNKVIAMVVTGLDA